MRKILSLCLALLALSLPARADEGHQHVSNAAAAVAFRTSVSAPKPLKMGQENEVTVSIRFADRTPVTERDLKEVHTRKVHFLVVDQTLTDYHHLHPVVGKTPGTWVASFVPAKENNYRIWIDITPNRGSQQFLKVDLKGAKPCKTACIDRQLSDTGEAAGLKVALSLESPLKAETAAMATIKVTEAGGKPVSDLEPVMGAFAHIVGFYDDFANVVHVHPMGPEPTSPEQRGGPVLSFHIEPEQTGYLKLYIQLRRGGKDIFVPLGLAVQ